MWHNFTSYIISLNNLLFTLWLHTGHQRLFPVRVSWACFDPTTCPPPLTSAHLSLFILLHLTSSFTAVVTTTATRCHRQYCIVIKSFKSQRMWLFFDEEGQCTYSCVSITIMCLPCFSGLTTPHTSAVRPLERSVVFCWISQVCSTRQEKKKKKRAFL